MPARSIGRYALKLASRQTTRHISISSQSRHNSGAHSRVIADERIEQLGSALEASRGSGWSNSIQTKSRFLPRLRSHLRHHPYRTAPAGRTGVVEHTGCLLGLVVRMVRHLRKRCSCPVLVLHRHSAERRGSCLGMEGSRRLKGVDRWFVGEPVGLCDC